MIFIPIEFKGEEQIDKELNAFFAKQNARISKKSFPWKMQLNESLKTYLTKLTI